ncbi:hypothetical protein ACEPPN_010921 [Leptodophora sp. 'Broadleaf-Isolate-01']
MSVPTPLSYTRAADEQPVKPPTTFEILASTETMKAAEPWAHHKVVGVGEQFIVKYGRHVKQLKGNHLLFLELQQLREFSPLLYALWRGGDGVLFLVMERLRGETLESLWPALLEAVKLKVLVKLREAFERFRALPQNSYFGSVTQSHLPSTLSGTHMKPTFFSSHLSLDLVKADRKPVFTHSDLQRKNILVEEVQVSKGEKEFRVKVVDWESAG